MGKVGSHTGRVDAAPDDVFTAIGDLERLTEWNARIEQVLDRPPRLEVGAEWLVELRIFGQRFQSRSRVLEIDRDARRLRYRSNPEGDPDYSMWTWEVTPSGGGSTVHVSWDLNPQQFANRHFWVHMRSRALKKELPASLSALEALIAHDRGSPVRDG
jgi:uncharacterized protein YndB with AHSA1/START domain